MGQLEYGDYYKFTASAGITLIAGAVVVPWMFLREPFDLAVEVSKVALLTPDAQRVINSRQHLVAIAIHYLPWASGVMAAAGLALLIYGLLSWRARQVVRDRAEDLQNRKLDKELQTISPKELETKAENESEIAENLDPGSAAFQADTPSGATSLLAVEQALLGRISTCLGSSMKVRTNQRLGNVQFDAIIRAGATHRIIIEIKYIRRGFNRGWMLETMTNLSLRMAVYSRTFNEEVRGLLLIVIGTDNSPLVRKAETISKELQHSTLLRFDTIRVQTIDESEIATMGCEQLQKMILS